MSHKLPLNKFVLLVLFIIMTFISSHEAAATENNIIQTPRNTILLPLYDTDESSPTKEENKPCDEGNDNRASDLCAQWKAADAAAQAAYWTGASFWVSLVGVITALATLCAAAAAALYAKQAAHTARSAFSVQTEPFLQICFDDNSSIKMKPYGDRLVAANGGEETWFFLRNLGLSPIVVIELCRRWDFSEPAESPEPIEYGGKLGDEIIKACHIPIGPGQLSSPIRMLFEEWQRMGMKPNNKVYFHGYVVFKDIRGKKFITGFCATTIDGRMHTVLPKENSERHNFQREIT